MAILIFVFYKNHKYAKITHLSAYYPLDSNKLISYDQFVFQNLSIIYTENMKYCDNYLILFKYLYYDLMLYLQLYSC